jgi:RNA polymerase sigma-70 factor, ECF subfamily
MENKRREPQLREPEPDSFPEEADMNEGSAIPPASDTFESDAGLEPEQETDLSSMAMGLPMTTPFLAAGNANDAAVRRAEATEANSQEEAIVARVLAGDTEAFSELIDRYKVAVFNLCARMLGDPTEAEDAAQEVFVRAYTQLHSYQPGRRFSTWLLSIASHYCIDLLRRRKPVVDLDAIAFWKQSDQPEPEETALTTEARDEVRELLAKLPEKYRGVTVLRYWNDMSYDEIAEATGLSVATVKTRLFRARELLAKEIEKRQNPTADIKKNGRGLLRSRKS